MEEVVLNKRRETHSNQSELSSLQSYCLSLFPMPMEVAERLEKIQRDIH